MHAYAYMGCQVKDSAGPEGFATLNFCHRDSGIFGILAWLWDCWINSYNCDSCLTNKALCFMWLLIYGKYYLRINVEIIIPDSRIFTWFPDSSSESKWFLEPLMWFRTVVDPLARPHLVDLAYMDIPSCICTIFTTNFQWISACVKKVWLCKTISK